MGQRDCALERAPIALAEGRPEDPRAKASAEIARVDPFGTATTSVRLKRNCDVARCAVPRHLKLRAMVGRGGIHGSS